MISYQSKIYSCDEIVKALKSCDTTVMNGLLSSKDIKNSEFLQGISQYVNCDGFSHIMNMSLYHKSESNEVCVAVKIIDYVINNKVDKSLWLSNVRHKRQVYDDPKYGVSLYGFGLFTLCKSYKDSYYPLLLQVGDNINKSEYKKYLDVMLLSVGSDMVMYDLIKRLNKDFPNINDIGSEFIKLISAIKHKEIWANFDYNKGLSQDFIDKTYSLMEAKSIVAEINKPINKSVIIKL